MRCVFSRRTQLVVVRSLDRMLVMSVLKYASQIRDAQEVHPDLGAIPVSAAELKLAQTLINASTAKQANLARYHDDYTDQVHALIDAQVKGKKLVAAPSTEPPAVINLMDALRKSLGKTKGRSAARTAPTGRQSAGGTRRAASHPPRRKSS